MISFNNIKIEPELNYLFITNTIIEDIKWCFEQAGLTDYEIHPYSVFDTVLPKDMNIPDVKLVPLPEANATRLCRKPYVIISHMNTHELTEKIYDIIRRNDSDLINYHKQKQKIAKTTYEENYKNYLDGQIPIASKE